MKPVQAAAAKAALEAGGGEEGNGEAPPKLSKPQPQIVTNCKLAMATVFV